MVNPDGFVGAFVVAVVGVSTTTGNAAIGLLVAGSGDTVGTFVVDTTLSGALVVMLS